MPQSITHNFNSYNADQFIESLSGSNKLYFSISRPQVWPNENSPPNIVNTNFSGLSYSAETIALKRILRSDAKKVVKRYDWYTNIVYTQYDNQDESLFDKNFYVLTLPENDVYKCISNNNGALSSIKPTGRSTSFISTADGYVWKFLYTLTDTDLLKFHTLDYMAVNENLDVSRISIPGTIDNIIITTPGNNFISANNVVVSIVGDGVGAYANTVVLSAANSIGKINLTAIGRNYTYAEANVKTIRSDPGVNTRARVIISPVNGHGSNIADELGSKYVMINSRIDYAEGGGRFPTVNDYRRIAIVQNPTSLITEVAADGLALSATYSLKLSNTSGTFTTDEIISGMTTKANAFVVSYNSNVAGNALLRYIVPIEYRKGNTIFRVGETIVGNTSVATSTILEINPPEVVPNTGKILYAENRSKISRNADQAENVHIVIEF
jgi:hypothetical protein